MKKKIIIIIDSFVELLLTCGALITFYSLLVQLGLPSVVEYSLTIAPCIGFLLRIIHKYKTFIDSYDFEIRFKLYTFLIALYNVIKEVVLQLESFMEIRTFFLSSGFIYFSLAIITTLLISLLRNSRFNLKGALLQCNFKQKIFTIICAVVLIFIASNYNFFIDFMAIEQPSHYHILVVILTILFAILFEILFIWIMYILGSPKDEKNTLIH